MPKWSNLSSDQRFNKVYSYIGKSVANIGQKYAKPAYDYLKKRKVDLVGRHWFLTWNNPPENGKAVLDDICLMCSAYVFQMEVASSGTRHWQGCFSFKHPKFWSQLDNKLDPPS